MTAESRQTLTKEADTPRTSAQLSSIALDQSHTWVSDTTAHHQNFPNVTTVLEVRMECAGVLISCCRNLIWYRLLVLLLDSFHQSLKRI